MAGNPLEAMALLGVGFRTISMSPNALGGVKSMVRSLRLGDIEIFVKSLLDSSDHSVRGKLSTFARDHGVEI